VVFDVERTFTVKASYAEHVDRLYRPRSLCALIRAIAGEMQAISEEVIARNEALREAVGDFTVTQFVTRGPGRWAHQAGPPAVCVKVAPIVFERYARHYTEGAHGVIARTRSYSSESLDPKVKHYSRMNFNLAELRPPTI
jgi:hypothetical protein